MKRLILFIAFFGALLANAQEMDTTFFVNEQGQKFGIVHEKGTLPVLPSSRQLSTFMQAQPKEPTAQENPALSFDSTAYYQSLVDRNTRRGHAIRKCGKGMILGGGIGAGVGLLSVLLAGENRKDNDDFDSDFSEMMYYSGTVMMIGGAAIFTAGFVVKGVGSSRLRRARRYQRKLDRYKMKQQHALEMQVFPLVDPVNGQFGGMLTMNF